MVALGILALSLMVMIEMQSTSVLLSSDADRISKATVLADEKMREVLLVLEKEELVTRHCRTRRLYRFWRRRFSG